MSLFEPGTYPAVVKDVSLWTRGENERLSLAVKLDIQGKELVNNVWLELNDGSISQRAIDTLKKCFPNWDGTIEALDVGECCREVEVEVVTENEAGQKDPSKTYTKVKWMNPPGGSAAMPERADAKTLATKYGAKFRALAGGTKPPARPATAKPKAPPAKKAAPPSTAEEAYEAFCKANDSLMPEALTEAWYAAMDAVMPGKDQEKLTPEDWGKVKAHVTK